MMHAKLAGRQVILVVTILEWAEAFETTDRVVAKTRLADGVEVSTVFLGIDHGHGDDEYEATVVGGSVVGGLWFETMVFDGPEDGFQIRWATYEQAEKGHAAVVCWLQGKRKTPPRWPKPHWS